MNPGTAVIAYWLYFALLSGYLWVLLIVLHRKNVIKIFKGSNIETVGLALLIFVIGNFILITVGWQPFYLRQYVQFLSMH